MASMKKIFHAKKNYIHPTSDTTSNTTTTNGAAFEFNEADVYWNSNQQETTMVAGQQSSEQQWTRNTIPILRLQKKKVEKKPVVSASLPVNIPDWSKIMRDGHHMRSALIDEDVNDDDEDRDMRLPPHEHLLRTRGASSSVQEGIGRTLKGRDLRQVRNAIWEKTGFED